MVTMGIYAAFHLETFSSQLLSPFPIMSSRDVLEHPLQVPGFGQSPAYHSLGTSIWLHQTLTSPDSNLANILDHPVYPLS